MRKILFIFFLFFVGNFAYGLSAPLFTVGWRSTIIYADGGYVYYTANQMSGTASRIFTNSGALTSTFVAGKYYTVSSVATPTSGSWTFQGVTFNTRVNLGFSSGASYVLTSVTDYTLITEQNSILLWSLGATSPPSYTSPGFSWSFAVLFANPTALAKSVKFIGAKVSAGGADLIVNVAAGATKYEVFQVFSAFGTQAIKLSAISAGEALVTPLGLLLSPTSMGNSDAAFQPFLGDQFWFNSLPATLPAYVLGVNIDVAGLEVPIDGANGFNQAGIFSNRILINSGVRCPVLTKKFKVNLRNTTRGALGFAVKYGDLVIADQQIAQAGENAAEYDLSQQHLLSGALFNVTVTDPNYSGARVTPYFARDLYVNLVDDPQADPIYYGFIDTVNSPAPAYINGNYVVTPATPPQIDAGGNTNTDDQGKITVPGLQPAPINVPSVYPQITPSVTPSGGISTSPSSSTFPGQGTDPNPANIAQGTYDADVKTGTEAQTELMQKNNDPNLNGRNAITGLTDDAVSAGENAKEILQPDATLHTIQPYTDNNWDWVTIKTTIGGKEMILTSPQKLFDTCGHFAQITSLCTWFGALLWVAWSVIKAIKAEMVYFGMVSSFKAPSFNISLWGFSDGGLLSFIAVYGGVVVTVTGLFLAFVTVAHSLLNATDPVNNIPIFIHAVSVVNTTGAHALQLFNYFFPLDVIANAFLYIWFIKGLMLGYTALWTMFAKLFPSKS